MESTGARRPDGIISARPAHLAMRSWKTRQRRLIFHQPPWLSVEQHTVELPDGRVIDDWPWVITPDYINVVVQMEDGSFLCFRQTKYAVEGPTLALVGGYLEPGEAALAAAQREVREETGCEAAEWIDLGRYRVDANRGAGIGHLFLARGARRVAEPAADDLEEQQIIFLSRAQLEAAVMAGEFRVLAWAAAAAFALARLRPPGGD